MLDLCCPYCEEDFEFQPQEKIEISENTTERLIDCPNCTKKMKLVLDIRIQTMKSRESGV